MRIKKGLISLILLIIPFNVYADDFEVTLSCPDAVSPGESFNCSISISSSIPVTSFTADYDMSDSNVNHIDYNNSDGITSGTVATFSFSIPSDSLPNYVYSVSVKNIKANGDALTSSDKVKSVRAKSNLNKLASITLSSGSISFNSDVTEYNNIVVDSNVSSISITAIAFDKPRAQVAGDGAHELKYGSNEIKITVTPEIGDALVYTLTIIRTDNRSNENHLKDLAISNTNLNFDKETTKYDLTTTSDQVFISAVRENNTKITGDIGNKTLSYGLNKFKITVIAENETKRVYEINITRIDNRSDNNYLKSITLSKGTLKFNKNTTTYNVDVENDVEKVKIDATLDDSKSKFVDKYGPREVGLKEGNNTFELRVVNEKGEQKTYTININRKDGRSSDSTLKSITLSEGKIDFKPDVLEYRINVEYKIEKIKVTAVATSDKSKVTIDGDGDLSLGANTIKITVEAENGKKTTYKIIVTRKEEGYKLSSNNYITSLVVKNYPIDFSSDVYRYTIQTKEKKLDLSISLEDNKSTYEIIGNKSLKDGSKITIKVTAENGDVRNYIIDIQKPSNFIVIAIIILVTLITVGIIAIILINRRKKLNRKTIDNDYDESINNTEQIETLEDDFSEV